MCDDVFAHCLFGDLPDYAKVDRPLRMSKEDEILDSDAFDDSMVCVPSPDTPETPGDDAGADAEEMEVEDFASEPFDAEEQSYEQVAQQDVLSIVENVVENLVNKAVEQARVQHIMQVIKNKANKKGPTRRYPTRNGAVHTFGIVDGRRAKRLGRPPGKKGVRKRKDKPPSRRGLQRNILDDQKVLGIRYVWQHVAESDMGHTRKYLSKAYNISLRTIRQILHNETWKHVDLDNFVLDFCECPEDACKCSARRVGTFVRV